MRLEIDGKMSGSHEDRLRHYHYFINQSVPDPECLDQTVGDSLAKALHLHFNGYLFALLLLATTVFQALESGLVLKESGLPRLKQFVGCLNVDTNL